MSGVALLVFREVLEAALIISIVCAATRGLPDRGWFVSGGIVLGVIGAVGVALGADAIGQFADGAGRDLFNAGVLVAAVLMIGWHLVWMSSHGRELAQHMHTVASAAKSGSSLTALLVVVALAVLREGSEIVLFLYSMAVGGVGTTGLVTGAALGAGGGVLLGVALYFGLLQIPFKRFFAVTNAMLMLLAAGLAAAAAGFLVQSDLLPTWGTPVWDTSRLLADDSLPGKTLGVLVGYKAKPEGVQVAFYLITLVVLIMGTRWRRRYTPAYAVVLCVTLCCVAGLARADDFIVYSPHVTTSLNEVELRGYHYSDSRADIGGSATELSIARGVNGWWKPELYVLEYLRTPDAGNQRLGYEFENTFQLSAPGRYWADFGFLAAYEHNIIANTPDAIEFGPLVEMSSGRFAQRLNFILEKQVGAGASHSYEYRYSYSGTYAVSQSLRPGIEAYGRPADNAYQAGPIVAGEWHIPGTDSGLEYRLGVALGINAAAPRQTWMAQLEYEFF